MPVFAHTAFTQPICWVYCVPQQSHFISYSCVWEISQPQHVRQWSMPLNDSQGRARPRWCAERFALATSWQTVYAKRYVLPSVPLQGFVGCHHHQDFVAYGDGCLRVRALRSLSVTFTPKACKLLWPIAWLPHHCWKACSFARHLPEQMQSCFLLFGSKLSFILTGLLHQTHAPFFILLSFQWTPYLILYLTRAMASPYLWSCGRPQSGIQKIQRLQLLSIP